VSFPVSQIDRLQAAHECLKLIHCEKADPRQRDDLIEAFSDLLELVFAREIGVVVALSFHEFLLVVVSDGDAITAWLQRHF